jgi:hypothetical protein
MTEYEIADLLNGVNSNITAGQAVFLSVLSAYLVVAYSVGKNLTTYQVSFINFVFILMMFVGFNAQAELLETAYAYGYQLDSLRPGAEAMDTTAEAVKIVFMVMRAVLVVGALVFMWQVRHPKTE